MDDAPEKTLAALDEPDSAGAVEVGVELKESPRIFTLWERAQIFVASWVGYFAVWLIGRSLGWEVVDRANFEAGVELGKGIIFAFWHREIFAATWFWRKRGVVVMTSQNFDGEYIARIIRKHGCRAARGSSSRGATRAMREMIRAMRRGHETAFAMDGPRGPRFVAKPGAVLLSRATGAPILCFHIALRRAYVFRNSWDLFQIPYPFTRSAVFIAPPIFVPRDADEDEQSRKLQEVQLAMDRLRSRGEEWKTSGH